MCSVHVLCTRDNWFSDMNSIHVYASEMCLSVDGLVRRLFPTLWLLKMNLILSLTLLVPFTAPATVMLDSSQQIITCVMMYFSYLNAN